MQDVIRFPLPTKPLKTKQKAQAITPAHIIFVIESVLADKLPLVHAPVILSYTYTGVFTIKEADGFIILKVKDDSFEFSFLIKNSSFQV